MKGGAAGGGHAQVVPMEDMNLHFTGDFHAITSAHNLLSAMIDNHVYWGNKEGIDTRRVAWRRVMDMNDRALRQITCSLGGVANGFPREAGFDITVASEVMAVLCLSKDQDDLQKRLGSMIVAYRRDRSPVYCRDMKADGAMTVLLQQAVQPNLVQTLENNPAFVHGGPFANIAHGCNSVIATTTALKLADYVVTEAGFGADLGAEKFMNIKCRQAGLRPKAVVIVATIRALKMNGGVAKSDLGAENVAAVQEGCANLGRHIEEHAALWCTGRCCHQPLHDRHGSGSQHRTALCQIDRDRGIGLQALGIRFGWNHGSCRQGGRPDRQRGGWTINRSILMISAWWKKLKRLPGKSTGPMEYLPTRRYDHNLNSGRMGDMVNCQYAWPRHSTVLPLIQMPRGAPSGHTIPIREVRLSAGAGFVVAICGEIMTMPGLPSVPAAEAICINDSGQIDGLF